MKSYTIIGGADGVGKSSFTGSLKAQSLTLGTIIDVDKITVQCGNNAIDGAKKAIEKLNECLDNGYSFTQETTLSGNKTVLTCRKAREKGYYIRLYYIGLNTEDESINRIKNRVKKGGHDIPQETVIKRFKNRFEALKKVLPYCDDAIFFDNDNGFCQVAEYKNGELMITVSDPPVWVTQMKNEITDL